MADKRSMNTKTPKTKEAAMDEKLRRFAESMVQSFRDEVMEGDREDNIYELIDYMNAGYRADCPENIFDQATKLACDIYQAKA